MSITLTVMFETEMGICVMCPMLDVEQHAYYLWIEGTTQQAVGTLYATIFSKM